MTSVRRIDRGSLGRAALAGAACAGLGLGGATPAVAQYGYWPFDEEPFFETPPTLPEGINGIIRRSEAPRSPARVDRITDVFAAMRGCWQPTGDPSEQQITLRLSFRRNGEVIGRPRITYAQARGDRDTQQRFRSSVFEALERCAPLPFTAGFGSAIAGRPFTFRFVDDRPA